MDLDEALATLGLRHDTTWPEVRAAYRARIRAVHPDVARGRGREAATLNAAFSVLERVYRRGEPAPPRSSAVNDTAAAGDAATTPRSHPRRARFDAPYEGPIDMVAVDDDGLALVAPADEVFHRLATVIDDIGDVTYADPDGGYLEAVVAEGCAQLVVSLQGRAHATEAFFTLEPMDARAVPPIESIVRQIAARLRAMT